MTEIYSGHWDMKLGVCEKHGLPQVPCPSCMATQDPDVQVSLTRGDRILLEDNPEFTLADLFGEGEEWLVERIDNLY